MPSSSFSQDYPAPFIDFGRWIFLAVLAFAPWAFGATRHPEEMMVARFLLSSTGLWGFGHVLARRWPRFPRIPFIILLLLLLQGWWMTYNARMVLDPEFGRFLPVATPVESLPGSVNKPASADRMLLYTGLLGAFCIVADMVQHRRWRARLLVTVGLIGTSIILYGMVLRLLSIRKILWRDDLPGHTWPFATYLYHGNAGAFINLVVPFLAAITVFRFEKSGAHVQRAGWVSALAICVGGIVVNASKAAMVIGGLEVLLLSVWAWRTISQRDVEVNARAVAVYIGVVAAAFIGVAWSVGWEMSMERWAEFGDQINGGNLRLLAHQCALRACGDAGFFGFGPGTFAAVFPYYTADLGKALAGTWSDAHQDYLQTMIEWGSIGAVLWSALLFGGIAAGVYTLLRSRHISLAPSALSMCWAAVVALLGVSLHALVDFPLQIASLQLFTMVMLGVVWGSLRWHAPRGARRSRERSANVPARTEPAQKS